MGEVTDHKSITTIPQQESRRQSVPRETDNIKSQRLDDPITTFGREHTGKSRQKSSRKSIEDPQTQNITNIHIAKIEKHQTIERRNARQLGQTEEEVPKDNRFSS